MDKREILQNERPLTPGFIPEKLLHRQDKVREIKDSIRPMIKGKKPENLFLCGPPGTCKSSRVKKALKELNDNSTASTVYVNAWNYDTRTSCYAKILHNLGVPMPRKGKPVDVLYDRIVEAASKKRSLVIAVDEIDQLGAEMSKTLYDLATLGDKENVKAGLIMIGCDPQALTKLDRRVKSRLSPKTIEFPSYTEEELRDILDAKVSEAFHQEAVSEQAIHMIAAFVANKSGDCRLALKILMKAGRRANSKGLDRLQVSILEETLESY